MQKYNVGQKINEAWTILILTKCSWKDWFLSISHFGVLSQPQKLKVYSLAGSKEKNRETLISNLKPTILANAIQEDIPTILCRVHDSVPALINLTLLPPEAWNCAQEYIKVHCTVLIYTPWYTCVQNVCTYSRQLHLCLHRASRPRRSYHGDE